jgi:hypothetical protein
MGIHILSFYFQVHNRLIGCCQPRVRCRLSFLTNVRVVWGYSFGNGCIVVALWGCQLVLPQKNSGAEAEFSIGH